jgi:hypothetical protein
MSMASIFIEFSCFIKTLEDNRCSFHDLIEAGKNIYLFINTSEKLNFKKKKKDYHQRTKTYLIISSMLQGLRTVRRTSNSDRYVGVPLLHDIKNGCYSNPIPEGGTDEEN